MSLSNSAIFSCASITKIDYAFLCGFIKGKNIKTILEFGPGVSTLCFLECGCSVTAFESDDIWFTRSVEKFSGFGVNIYKFANVPEIQSDNVGVSERFDMAFVDSPQGIEYENYSRLNVCIFVSNHTDLILLHDTNRQPERQTIEAMLDIGWSLVFELDSERGIAVLENRKRCFE